MKTLIIEPFEGWQRRVYKYYGCKMGDIIVKSCRHYKGDNSEDATITFMLCFDLLMERKRWPDQFDWIILEEYKCHSRLCSWVHKMKFRFLKWWYMKIMGCDEVTKMIPWERHKIKYRSQGDMTRDPYISWIAWASERGRWDMIKQIKYPWYLYRPRFHWFVKFMQEDNKKKAVRYLANYELWYSIEGDGKKKFTRELSAEMERAVENKVKSL